MIDIIWTTHLKERARQRGIDPALVDRTIRFPDKVEASRTTSAKKHIKIIGHQQVVAAVKREGNNWIVVSVWSKPYFGPAAGRPLLERLVYRFVRRLADWLEKRIRARFKF